MRPRLVHTLSLLLICAVLLAVLAMGAVMAWNLRHGFSDYLTARDAERLEQFAALVSETAAQAGSLAALQQSTDMRRLLDQFAQRQGLVPRGDALPDAAAAWPRAGPGAGPGVRPGPGPGPGSGAPPPRRGPPPGAEDDFGARVVVVDAEGRTLLSRPRAPMRPWAASPGGPFVERPIQLNGVVVAFARMRPDAHVPDAVETRFLRSQYLGILAVAAALLLLALVSAWWVARRWARPLQAVQAATARIARGEFNVRLRGPQQGEGRGDEIGDLVRDVNLMAGSLQQLEGARRRWLADISHELRTPLTVLRGEIEALVDAVRPLSRDALLSLQEDVLRLGKLVDDLHLLAMSDLQSLPCHFASDDAGDIVRRAVARWQPRAAAKGLALSLDADPLTPLPVLWDRARVDQLLGNVFENSLRYTDAPGRIVVRLSRAGELITIEFNDSAPGVPGADLPRVLEPLYRADAARSRHLSGSGLGLAICQVIARSHGGQLAAAPSPLGGLQIKIELPAVCAQQGPTRSAG